MKITFCRMGKYPKCNTKHRGAFTREFGSLESLAKFIKDNRRSLYCPNLRKEITNEQWYAINQKFRSLLTH